MTFWNFAFNEEEDIVELRIDGEIVSDDDIWLYEWFGISAAAPNRFRNELKKYKGKDIKVWIDSYGGNVFAGTGIYNALKAHDGKVITIADGKAMSAAFTIWLAGDERLVTPGSLTMLHNPSLMYVGGEAADMRKYAETLDEVKEAIINIYEDSTGIDREKISEMMDDTTYMSAKKAIAEGFATDILEQNVEVKNVVYNSAELNSSINSSFMALFKIKEDLSKDNDTGNKGNNEPKNTGENEKEVKGQVPINLYEKLIKSLERRKR